MLPVADRLRAACGKCSGGRQRVSSKFWTRQLLAPAFKAGSYAGSGRVPLASTLHVRCSLVRAVWQIKFLLLSRPR